MNDIKEDVAVWGFDFPMWDILAFCGENASLHCAGVIYVNCDEPEPWPLDDGPEPDYDYIEIDELYNRI